MSKPTLEQKFRALGTCGCKDRCAEEDGMGSKPNEYGVCEMAAADAGLTPPEALPEDKP